MAKKRKTSKRAQTRKKTTSKTETQPEPLTSFGQLSDEDVESFLKSGQHEHLLREHFGDELYRDLVDLARRPRLSTRRSGQRVLLLPGIMGSKLGVKGRFWNDQIWLDPVDVAAGKLVKLKLGASRSITSLGVMLHAYLPTKLRLAYAGFNVDFHHYDWRQSIDRLAATSLAESWKRQEEVMPPGRRA